MHKTNKVLDTGLASLTKAPGALLRGMKAQGTFSRESQKPGKESEQDGFPRSRELAKERDKEKKKEKHGDPSSDGAKVLYQQKCSLIYLQ